jgi:hypothetical protein
MATCAQIVGRNAGFPEQDVVAKPMLEVVPPVNGPLVHPLQLAGLAACAGDAQHRVASMARVARRKSGSRLERFIVPLSWWTGGARWRAPPNGTDEPTR